MFIKKAEPIIIGVSGGPDSMYLLNDLVKQGYTNIIACHVNYNYRTDSKNDEQIVKSFCNEHNVKLEVKNIDKEVYKNNNIGNFENFARNERYDFFVEVAKQYRAKYCFIAHNLNDSIETYLLQKQRNNLVDHYGLMVVSNYEDLIIVRPLLSKKKSEILAFDKQNNIPFAIDSTNSDLTFERNKIRSELKEGDFAKIQKEISVDNAKNEKLKTEAKFYALNNKTAKEMQLTKEFFNFEIDKIM